jgi:hypothetical protein
MTAQIGLSVRSVDEGASSDRLIYVAAVRHRSDDFANLPRPKVPVARP